MPRTVFLRDWDEAAESPGTAGPQYTYRLTSGACRYPNRIREYRLQHRWRQRDVAEQIGCRNSTIGSWERGRTMPHGPRLLRLAKVLDTLVESLYYELYTVEKFLAVPPRVPSIPLSAPLEIPARSKVAFTTEPSPRDWPRQLLTMQLLDDTVRARHQNDGTTPVWVPISHGTKLEAHEVPYIAWDRAPAVAKSLLMTVHWMRQYTQHTGKSAHSSTTRLAYESYLKLFTPHEAALKMPRQMSGVRRAHRQAS